MSGSLAEAQPAALVGQTEASTRLGYVLQEIIEILLGKVLDKKIKITPNAAYAHNVIKPDLLLGPVDKPEVSIHVTCSDNRDSFRMKRWRYVCELFQLKAFKRDVYSIDVVFGDRSLYQPADLILLDHIFDATADFTTHKVGRKVFRQAKALSQAATPSKQAASEILKSLKDIEKNALIEPILTLVNQEVREIKDLWTLDFERPKGGSKIKGGIDTHIRGLFLKSLLLEDNDFRALKLFYEKAVDEPPLSAIDVGLVELFEDVDGDSFELSDEVSSLFSSTLLRLRQDVFSDSRCKIIIGEAQNIENVRKWATGCHRLMRGEPSEKAVKKILDSTSDHPRVIFLDLLGAIYKRSINSMEGDWPEDEVPTGIKNPLANIISKTKLIGRLTSKKLAVGLLGLWKAIDREESRAAMTSNDVVNSIHEYRKYCVRKGSVVNPLDVLLNQTIEGFGYRSLGKKRFASVNMTGSKLSTEFKHSFESSRNGKRVAIKNLFGDTGADHKAEEMAGRLFLAPYQLTDSGAVLNKDFDAWSFLFVPVGIWNRNHVDVLVSAGWYVSESEGIEQGLIDLIGKA